MIYFFLLFLTSFLFSAGFVVCRSAFFRLARHTMAMLNVILDTQADDNTKQKLLVRQLGRLLLSLILFLFFIACIVGCAALPLLVYTHFDLPVFENLDWTSLTSYVCLVGGGLIPFIIFHLIPNKGDYSEWSMLLHHMILDNYNISHYLFLIEKKIFSSKTVKTNSDFVIVSGLARSGTSALTTLLHQSGSFHSLNYANMPFILSPNGWRIFYNPKDKTLKERSHGDKVLFGYNTVEALEEYFFKVFLNDSFIHEKTLCEHSLDEATYNNYLAYQRLLQEKTTTTYLAKNNNFILRYRSLRTWNKEFKVIFIFRHPVEHAYSLFKQHERFSALQSEDPFTLEYMNWLGHHEFGRNLKHFQFLHTAIPKELDPASMDYWLHTWINYYTMILNLEDDPNRILLQYEDFLHEPKKTICALSDFLKLPISLEHLEPFKNDNSYTGDINPVLLKACIDLYLKLMVRKISI
ncbi:MAG: sulfotransferase family protein [Chitinophagaceae bacterium]|nr:sulfotransferase family protein [Chitinophagaceae bacterium]